ncbi:N-acetyltransferase 9-like protein [Smittium culicis]|uniref:N-acetyltransferase 9-like protein n=1 Tax=Smittium culicis TaxID=133412 RepID=A0A1R1YLB1_9FUNG|nr:N-acetyltransferase 9-like protein [Smittium culicis]
MIGDVNLYINDDYNSKRAEIEVMIAENKFRGQGIAQEALELMMKFSVTKIGINTFYGRILEKNSASIGLFKKLGFVQTERSEFFKQVTLELQLDDDSVEEYKNSYNLVKNQNYL